MDRNEIEKALENATSVRERVRRNNQHLYSRTVLGKMKLTDLQQAVVRMSQSLADEEAGFFIELKIPGIEAWESVELSAEQEQIILSKEGKFTRSRFFEYGYEPNLSIEWDLAGSLFKLPVPKYVDGVVISTVVPQGRSLDQFFGRGGGADEMNDCFYNAMIQARIPGFEEMFPNPASFKKRFGIERNALVHTKYHLVGVGELYKNGIGKFLAKTFDVWLIVPKWYNNWHQSGKYKVEMKFLKLNGDYHYLLAYNNYPRIPHLQSNYRNEEREFCYYHRVGDSVEICKGNGLEQRDANWLKEQKKLCLYGGEYHLIKKPLSRIDGEIKDCEWFYNQKVELQQALQDVGINLKITPGKYTFTLAEFWKRNPCVVFNNKFPAEEVGFLERATTGGLIWHTKYRGPACLYDICSSYPAILQSNDFRFPRTYGKVVELVEPPTWPLAYGIYQAKVQEYQGPFFRHNPDDHYTHYDLEVARLLGLKIEFGKCWYKYDDLIDSKRLFEDFIQDLYSKRMRAKGNPLAESFLKQCLSGIWGPLTQRKRRELIVRDGTKYDHVIDDWKNLVKHSNEKGKTYVFKNFVNSYVFGTARMKPFLLAKARYDMYMALHLWESWIKRVHTDSVLLSCTIDELPSNDNFQVTTVKDVNSIGKWYCGPQDKFLECEAGSTKPCELVNIERINLGNPNVTCGSESESGSVDENLFESIE